MSWTGRSVEDELSRSRLRRDNGRLIQITRPTSRQYARPRRPTRPDSASVRPSGPFIVSAGCVYPASWLKSTPGTWQIAEEQKGKSVGGVCTPAPDLAPYFSISFSRVFAVSTCMIMPLHATRLNYRLVVLQMQKRLTLGHQAPYISDTCLVCVTIYLGLLVINGNFSKNFQISFLLIKSPFSFCSVETRHNM